MNKRHILQMAFKEEKWTGLSGMAMCKPQDFLRRVMVLIVPIIKSPVKTPGYGYQSNHCLLINR